MAPTIEQFLSLFSYPQGNLIYSLVLTICTFAAWLSCIYAQGRREFPTGRRMQIGLLFLVFAQLAYFITSWLAWLGIIDGHAYLPPVDRTIALFSLVLITWLWAIPEAHRIWDALVALTEVILLIIGVTGFVLWMRVLNTTFITSVVGAYSFYIGLILVVLGIFILFWQRPGYWGYGFIMLLVIFSGYMAQFYISQPASDSTWFVHAAEMVAFIFLLLLPKRLVAIEQVRESKPGVAPSPSATSAGMISRPDGRLIQSVADMVTEPSPQKYYQELTKLVGQVMNAGLCVLMIPPKTGDQLILPVGYDTSQGQILDGITADGQKMPSIIAALRAGSSLRMDASAGAEVASLVSELGKNNIGHLLMVPFQPKGTTATMGMAVLSKPAASMWTDADEVQLKDVTDTLLANYGKFVGITKPTEQAEIIEKLHHAEAYADQVKLEYAQLKVMYDSLAAQPPPPPAQPEDLKALQNQVIQLEMRNRDLENMLARGRPSMDEVEQLRLELRAALTDLARIPSTLSKSDQKMLETQLSAVKSLNKMQPTELVTSIAEEFRQPLSSIVGYTDLLLSESVGLLGAAQRKFLDRVKASSERMGILLNELVEVMTIDGGKVDQTAVSVELEPVIHEAVGNISAQLNEKNISMQLDLEDNLPQVRANKDALMQILDNLLENACLVTLQDGTIKLSAAVEKREGEQNFILLSIADQGGGIERTDISRVFLRRYKMENPLIKGVGDTGVGLSIVKSLVDLLKGRVWVDSLPGGSIFSVLLPLVESQVG